MLQTLQQILIIENRVIVGGFKADLTAVILYDCKSHQLETRPYT
jgi:hypothetical protein